ncbi:MAG: hypothetical protein AAFN77_07730 [Planctomycetota bacterium]
MRTTLSHWLKITFALLIATSFVSSVQAGDQDDSKKENPAKVKRNRAEERRMKTVAKTMLPAKGFNPVEMFSAMESGDVEVLIRTKDAANANIIVTNKTDQPLAIQMPEAFSAVPVYKQGIGGPAGGGGGFGGQGGGFGGQGGGGFGGQGGNQGIGGGFGGGQGGGGFGGGGFGGQGGGGFGGGQGGGVFNIPPGRVGKLQVKTFCLEHGKPDPQARLKYVIQPLDKLNSDANIFEMCRMLANDEIVQPVAQAAAWNVANGLTWQQLLVKNRIERMDGSFERYFHPMHLRYAQQVVVASVQRAKLRAEAKEESEKESSTDEDRYKARYQDPANAR